MPKPLFVFVQFDFPWTLGPADGRYLLRSRADGEPERVVVLQTLGEPAAPASRVTLVDPVSLAAESQARAWLDDVERDGRRAVEDALALANRVVYLHRIAAADPYAHELSATQALAIRAGWGAGEDLASGRYTYAHELPAGHKAGKRRSLLRFGGRRARSSELNRQERFASLLGAKVPTLLCEELALRARLDLDQGRLALAALALSSALSAAREELRGERREDLALRIDELEQLRAGVDAQARAALSAAGGSAPGQQGGGAREPAAGAGTAAPELGAGAAGAADATPSPPLDEEALGHALERLEAALRARAGSAARDRSAG